MDKHTHHHYCCIPVRGSGLNCCICEKDPCETGKLLQVAENMTAKELIALIKFKENHDKEIKDDWRIKWSEENPMH